MPLWIRFPKVRQVDSYKHQPLRVDRRPHPFGDPTDTYTQLARTHARTRADQHKVAGIIALAENGVQPSPNLSGPIFRSAASSFRR